MYEIKKLPRSPDWPAAIGRALMAFGDIERLTTVTIQSILGWERAIMPTKLPLEARIKYLDGLLRQDGAAADDLARWSEAYGIVQDLRARYRNRLAHGTPGDIVVVTDESITQTVEHVAPRKPADGLTLEDVKEVADRVERAHKQMGETALKIMMWLYESKRIPLASLPPLREPRTCPKCGADLTAHDDLPS